MSSQTNRRNFLLKVLIASGQITLASTAIYSIDLFRSNEKFGRLTAGAKTGRWTWLGNTSPCVDYPLPATEGGACTLGSGTHRGLRSGAFCRELECR